MSVGTTSRRTRGSGRALGHRMVRPAQWLLVAVVAAFCLSTVPGLRRDPGFDILLDGWLQSGAYLVAAVVCALRPATSRLNRLAWAAIAAGLALRALGFVLFVAAVRDVPPLPYPSAADAAWLASPVLLLAGLGALLRPRLAFLTTRVALDVAVAALICAAVAVAAMYGTLIGLTAPGLGADEVATNLAYPLADLMLLFAVLALLSSLRWQRTPALWLLGLAIVGFVVVDGVSLHQATAGTYRPGTALSALSLLATAAMAAAAWAPMAAGPGARRFTVSRSLVPACFGLAGTGLLVYATARHVPPVAVALAAAGLAVAIARALLTLRDVSHLTGELRHRATELGDSETLAREEAERLAAVLEGVEDYAIIGGDPEAITFFSAGAERMLGYAADEVIGTAPTPLFLPEELAARSADLGLAPGTEALVARPREGHAETREWTMVRRDGSRLPVSLTVTALLGPGGEPTGFLGVARDISADHRLARYRETRDAVARGLALEPDLKRAIAGALETVVVGLGWDAGSVWLPEDGELTLTAFSDGPTHTLPALRRRLQTTRVARGEGLAGRVWVTGEAAWLDDVRTFQGLSPQGEAVRRGVGEALRAVLCLPIPDGGGGAPIGVLHVFALRPRPRDEELLTYTETICAELGHHIERERAAQQLASALAEAERANVAKSDLVSRISHELRTPLSAVLGFAQLLARDPLSTAQRDHADHILVAGRHLLSLIDDLLDLGQAERGELGVSLEAVSAVDVLSDVLTIARPLLAERDLELEIDVHAGLFVHVLADVQRLRQVLLNLVANAVKYNGPGGKVVVAFDAPDPRHLRFLVRDTGAGIAPEDLGRLFVPFDRLGAEHGREQGTGLGLSVSRGLVAAMGGSLTVESVVGEGTTFAVELARTEAPSVISAITEPDAVPRWTGQSGAATILYIEDNPANVRLMSDLLGERPATELLTAADGHDGLELVDACRPDLVLLDAQLPDITGDVVLTRLKATPATAHIPVVVVSADASAHRSAHFRALGAEGYLTKPLDIGALVTEVDRVLARAPGPPTARGPVGHAA